MVVTKSNIVGPRNIVLSAVLNSLLHRNRQQLEIHGFGNYLRREMLQRGTLQHPNKIFPLNKLVLFVVVVECHLSHTSIFSGHAGGLTDSTVRSICFLNGSKYMTPKRKANWWKPNIKDWWSMNSTKGIWTFLRTKHSFTAGGVMYTGKRKATTGVLMHIWNEHNPTFCDC